MGVKKIKIGTCQICMSKNVPVEYVPFKFAGMTFSGQLLCSVCISVSDD